MQTVLASLNQNFIVLRGGIVETSSSAGQEKLMADAGMFTTPHIGNLRNSAVDLRIRFVSAFCAKKFYNSDYCFSINSLIFSYAFFARCSASLRLMFQISSSSWRRLIRFVRSSARQRVYSYRGFIRKPRRRPS